MAIFISFILEYVITKVQQSQEGMELNGKHQLQSYADDVNILDENLNRSTKALLEHNR
jgi:hypothetical protein